MGFIPVEPEQKKAAELARERRIIEQENLVFEHAYKTGRITEAEYQQAKAAQAARLADDKGVPVTSQPSKQTTAYLASVSFYEQAGFPQYGGVYGVPNIPKDTEIYKIEEKTTVKGRAGQSTQQEKSLEITVGPKLDYIYRIPSGFFGPVLFEPVKPTPEEKARLKERYLKGEDISAGSAMETRAMAGLTLATGVLTPIVTAKSLAWGAAYVAGATMVPATADVVKYSQTKEHLTPAEMVGWSAVGVAGVQIGRGIVESPMVKGRVQAMVDASYERQIRFNEAVLQGQVKGVTETWSPNFMGNQRVLYELTGKPSPQVNFAQQTNIARVTGGTGPYGLSDLQRVGVADELFDFGFVPKSSMRVDIVRPSTATVAKPSGLPLYYGLGMEFLSEMEFLTLKHEINRAEIQEVTKQRLIDEGVGVKMPEDIRGLNYGKLSFDYLKMEYDKGRFVSYEWTGPFQRGPSETAMGPLWGSKTSGASVIRETGKVTKPPDLSGPAKAAAVTMKPIVENVGTGALSNVAQQFTTKSVFTSGYDPRVWQGPAFYGTKGRVLVEETAYPLSYPPSGLPHPPKLGEEFVLDIEKAQKQRPNLGIGSQGFLLLRQRGLSTSIVDIGQGANLASALGVDTGQAARQMAAVGTALTTDLFTTTTQRQVFETPELPFNPKDLFGGFNLGAFSDFTAPSGGRRRRGPFGGLGRYKRVYPIVTGEQMLQGLLGKTKQTRKKGGRRKK